MAKAAEMVELAERFRLTMAAQQKQAQQGTGVSPAPPGSSNKSCPVLILSTNSAPFWMQHCVLPCSDCQHNVCSLLNGALRLARF